MRRIGLGWRFQGYEDAWLRLTFEDDREVVGRGIEMVGLTPENAQGARAGISDAMDDA